MLASLHIFCLSQAAALTLPTVSNRGSEQAGEWLTAPPAVLTGDSEAVLDLSAEKGFSSCGIYFLER